MWGHRAENAELGLTELSLAGGDLRVRDVRLLEAQPREGDTVPSQRSDPLTTPRERGDCHSRRVELIQRLLDESRSAVNVGHPVRVSGPRDTQSGILR